MVRLSQPLKLVEAGLYGVVSFLVALVLAWAFLAPQNFWYGMWHDIGRIGEAIERYGPENRYREGFADTTRQQRIELFAKINTAIHASGEGLASIEYTTRQHGTQLLLRKPEVDHLQDVANLLGFLKRTVLLLLFGWGMLLVRGYQRRQLPSLFSQFKGAGLGLLATTLMILAIGPTRVFYALHIWIFPENHQWFFYYQDSLMSTMMKAPVLFGWIAGALILWAAVFYCVLQWVLYKILISQKSP